MTHKEMYKSEILCNKSKSTKHQINSRVLKDFIVCLDLDFGDCRGQGYDGLNFSMPYVQVVAKKFKDNTAATSVHSLY